MGKITRPYRTGNQVNTGTQAPKASPAEKPVEDLTSVLQFLRSRGRLGSISQVGRFGRAVQSLCESIGAQWQMGHEPGLGYCKMFPRLVLEMVEQEILTGRV